MRLIDMETWPRREHFNFFNSYDQPHVAMTANADITAFYPYIKEHGYSFTIAVIYLLTRASNTVPEFRYRIRDGQVVEHETVHAGFTILVNDDVFSFCVVDYVENFPEFAESAAQNIAEVRANPWVKRVLGDDILFMTAIPWVSFTDFTHPMHYSPVDSVPRFAWGKYFEEAGVLKMPLNVQGHHALIDGVHMGNFYTEVQNSLHQPEVALD
jgi:chloramphenicol O-acetyltransferase type A